MSGNGIRCLAQAHAMANNTGPTSLEIDTPGGRRTSLSTETNASPSKSRDGVGGSWPGVHEDILNEIGSSLAATADLEILT